MLQKIVQCVSRYKEGIFLSILTACSYILGYVRDKIFAHFFGLSSTLDIYHASFVIPDTIMNLFLAGAMVSVIVPFTNKYKEDHLQSAYLSGILEIGIILNLFVCLIIFFLMPSIVPFVVQKAGYIHPVIQFSRVLLLSPIIFLMSNFLGGILVQKRNLIWYGLSPILYNVGIIGGVLLLHSSGIIGIILGALCGAVLHLLVRWTGVIIQKEKVKIAWINVGVRWGEIAHAVGYFSRLALPKMISLTVLHINYWLFTYFASQSNTEGSIFALNICKNFYNVPISIIAIALATDAFSLLSKEYVSVNKNMFLVTFRRYLVLIAGSGVLFGILYFYLSPFFISLLLKGGKFDQQAVIFTGTLLSFFGIVIMFESIMQYLSRVLHAMQDTFWQMVSQISCCIITFIILRFTFNTLGIIAIPISFSIGMLGQNVIQMIVIRYKLKFAKVPKKDAVAG